MIKSIIEKWTKQINDPKRRIQFFLISLVIIYFVWAFLFFNPVRKNKNELTSQIQTLQLQLTEKKQQINTINEAIKTEPIAKAIAEKQQLEIKIQKVQQALTQTHLSLVSMEDWKKLKKAIITEQHDMDKNITLESIKELPVQPASMTLNQPDAANVYQQILELKFQADYFSAVRYLSRLEKLPWHIYWDSLAYKVLAYPKADVTIQFHIFTQQRSEV